MQRETEPRTCVLMWGLSVPILYVYALVCSPEVHVSRDSVVFWRKCASVTSSVDQSTRNGLLVYTLESSRLGPQTVIIYS